MSNITLLHFEQSEVRTGEINGEPVFCLSDLLASMESKTHPSDAKAAIADHLGDGVVIQVPILDSLGRSQDALFTYAPGATFLLSRTRTSTGKRLNRWLHSEVLPSIGKTGSYSLESARAELEKKFLPTPTLKEIAEVAKTLKVAGFKQSYVERITILNLQKHHPGLLPESPKPQELESLPTAKALMNPTQIGEALGWFCKSNPTKGDARRVNKKLAELGYQEKVGGDWNPSDKAIGANLADRKPVMVDGKRSNVDQLLWSADILPILQEHSTIEAQVSALV
jgi:prophage antirepressor-like protein